MFSSAIDEWPTCRGAISCQSPPVPDLSATHLLPTESQDIVEYQYAVYSCKDGATLEGIENSIFAKFWP